MDTRLALFAHSGLPTEFWVKAFLIAIHLINRLPAPTLANQTPYFKLLNLVSDYNLWRIFGCSWFPLMRPYNPHKLTYRSKKCIFLNYGSNHRGYHCLDTLTHRVYISHHVLFNEFDFPTKSGEFLLAQVVHSGSFEAVLQPLLPLLGTFFSPFHIRFTHHSF